jgi:hypothetical protein
MATFEIESGGKTYEIEAPDQATAVRAVKSVAPPQEPYSGQLLPFSKDAQGNVSFDTDAGLVGVVKRAVTFPADAMRGKVDPLSDEGIARAVEAAGVMTPVSAASRGGLGWAGAPVKRSPVKPVVPSANELKGTGGFGFDMARQMDVRYTPQSVQNMALKLRSQLHAAGYRESNAPKVYAELNALSRPVAPGSFASIDDIHAIRMALGKAAQDFNNPTEQGAASQFISAIDDFITNPDPKAVVAGPVAGAGGVWDDAMGNYAAGKRSDRLQGIEESTGRRAAASNSGLNLDNTIRQRVSGLLDDPKKRSGFSQEELDLLETVAKGTAPRNVTRFIGNLLGGGGGLGAMITGMGAGVMTGSTAPMLLGTAVVGTGVAAKGVANRLTKSALRNADEAVRKRSPLYQDRVANPELAAKGAGVRSMPGRAAGATVVQQPPMTPDQWSPEMLQEFEEFLRQKYAPQQGA